MGAGVGVANVGAARVIPENPAVWREDVTAVVAAVLLMPALRDATDRVALVAV